MEKTEAKQNRRLDEDTKDESGVRASIAVSSSLTFTVNAKIQDIGSFFGPANKWNARARAREGNTTCQQSSKL